MISPKESSEYIARSAINVEIQKENISKLGDLLCEELSAGKLRPSNFSQVELHPKCNDPNALDWILLIDTLNFCFWHSDNEIGWSIDGYTGYFALCATINRAIKNNIKILDPKYYSTITVDDLSKILRSDSGIEIPLLLERVKCLHEVGNVLLEKYDGCFENMIRLANKSAIKLLKMIVDNFKCYRDEADYKGRRVSFYKRAQILIGDIWACYENKGLGNFTDIDNLTMFADYRIPQVLVYFGCLKYSDNLMEKLNKNVLLQNGDPDEVEIRGCSIKVVELIKEYISENLPDQSINSILIDHFLWDFRRKHANNVEMKNIPFHKTLSIYY